MVSKQEYKFINVFWQETASFFINSTPSNTEDMYIMYIDIKLFHIISYHELLYRDIYLRISCILHITKLKEANVVKLTLYKPIFY